MSKYSDKVKRRAMEAEALLAASLQPPPKEAVA